METLTENKKFILPNKKVQVVPVKRKGGWLPSNHEASFLYGNASYNVVCKQQDRAPGNFIDPFTKEEREYFENKELSGLNFNRGDLTIVKPKKGEETYLSSFRLPLKKGTLELDLSNPFDYITWKIILTNSDTIAPSGSEKYKKATYKYAIQENDFEAVEGYGKTEKLLAAYAKINEIKDSPTKLRNFLLVYTSPINATIKPAKNATKEFLVSELNKIIEKDIDGFLKMTSDVSFQTKLLIEQGIEVGGIMKRGTSFYLPSGDRVGGTLDEAVEYFDSKKNSEQRAILEARINK